jgi:hypothetical protein
VQINDRTVERYIVVVVEQKLCTFDKPTDPKRHLEAKLLMRHKKPHLRPDTTIAPGFIEAVGVFIRNPVDLTEASRLFVVWGIRPPLDDPSAGGFLNLLQEQQFNGGPRHGGHHRGGGHPS